jgi:hypothetical protein
VSRSVPWPDRAVILLADARIRAGGAPGLTDPLPLRQRERSQRDCCRRLIRLRRVD